MAFENGICRTAVEKGPGYFADFHLSPTELDTARKIVEAHWRQVILSKYPQLQDMMAAATLDRYHELSAHLDHASLWNKKARILSGQDCAQLLKFSLFDYLRSEFGDLEVTDDEGSGHGEIYWRLVRPHETHDIGPMHADSWFWKLGHGIPPAPGKARVKIWLALWCEPGKAGLTVVPSSQLTQWPFHGEMRHGFMKPCPDVDFSGMKKFLIPTKPGDAVIFSDDLLHGGTVTSGETTRVNLEWSVMLR